MEIGSGGGWRLSSTPPHTHGWVHTKLATAGEVVFEDANASCGYVEVQIDVGGILHVPLESRPGTREEITVRERVHERTPVRLPLLRTTRNRATSKVLHPGAILRLTGQYPLCDEQEDSIHCHPSAHERETRWHLPQICLLNPRTPSASQSKPTSCSVDRKSAD